MLNFSLLKWLLIVVAVVVLASIATVWVRSRNADLEWYSTVSAAEKGMWQTANLGYVNPDGDTHIVRVCEPLEELNREAFGAKSVSDFRGPKRLLVHAGRMLVSACAQYKQTLATWNWDFPIDIVQVDAWEQSTPEAMSMWRQACSYLGAYDLLGGQLRPCFQD